MNNKGADQTARMCRLVCICVVRKPQKTGFLASRLIYHNIPSSLIVITIYLIQAIVTQAERFLAEGVPLHGIGLQSHLKPYHVDITAIKVTIQIEICMCCFTFYF